MKKEAIERESRNWTIEDVGVDERFTECKKEWFITFFMVIGHILLMTLIFRVVGSDYREFQYVLGMPLHLFLVILELIAFIVTVYILLDKVYCHMDLTAIGKLYRHGEKEQEQSTHETKGDD